MTNPNYTFIDPTELTKWTRNFLYLQIGAAVVAVISGAMQYQLFNDLQNRVYTSQAHALAALEATVSRHYFVLITQSAISLVSAFLILKWTYRANLNAHALGAHEMQFAPGHTIFWYFPPLLNLWKPYQAMKEIWKASSSPQEWKSQPAPSLLRWWWFFWLIFQQFRYAETLMNRKTPLEMADAVDLTILSLLSNTALIPLSLIFLVMVGKIYEMQVSHKKPRP